MAGVDEKLYVKFIERLGKFRVYQAADSRVYYQIDGKSDIYDRSPYSDGALKIYGIVLKELPLEEFNERFNV
jgi:hypothetical protein